MAASSSGQLGALNAESHAERILSCANNVLVEGNTLLHDEELEMLVVLPAGPHHSLRGEFRSNRIQINTCKNSARKWYDGTLANLR
eukprot:CAMPEP_0195622194 /NCGR_PEP_ID=MMETSP0815-20121206/16081_1 /TAXON_ID=97485 /ORGANISM="Prymnesium parvum, Strain Texoma1" /LENGTH=85 /DNA_ID=CAMNT_0040762971 /DNA_START=328 /DNA_END=585 /DNA_ORIENTATION=+